MKHVSKFAYTSGQIIIRRPTLEKSHITLPSECKNLHLYGNILILHFKTCMEALPITNIKDVVLRFANNTTLHQFIRKL